MCVLFVKENRNWPLKGITYIDGDLGDIQVKLKLKDWINEMKK